MATTGKVVALTALAGLTALGVARATSQKKKPVLKLTYFNIAGVAEKVRLAFAVAGLDFEDVRINYADWGELKKKSKFGQLPILSIDGKTEIAQSNAMLYYAASFKPSLYPTDPCKRLQVDEVLGLAQDFDRDFSAPLYMGMRPQKFGWPEGSAQTEEGKARTKAAREQFCQEDLIKYLDFYTAFLEKNGPFFCGSELTIADLYILPQLAKFQAGYIDFVPTTVLDNHPLILAWLQRMNEVPEIKAWYASKK